MNREPQEPPLGHSAAAVAAERLRRDVIALMIPVHRIL